MRLSEAIRLGAMLKPQGFGYQSIDWMRVPATCAYGAALEAVGEVQSVQLQESILTKHWPWLKDAGVLCPAKGCVGSCIYVQGMYVVWHLNDIHRWTRERIADYVATVEPREQPGLSELPKTGELVAV